MPTPATVRLKICKKIRQVLLKRWGGCGVSNVLALQDRKHGTHFRSTWDAAISSLEAFKRQLKTLYLYTTSAFGACIRGFLDVDQSTPFGKCAYLLWLRTSPPPDLTGALLLESAGGLPIPQTRCADPTSKRWLRHWSFVVTMTEININAVDLHVSLEANPPALLTDFF